MLVNEGIHDLMDSGDHVIHSPNFDVSDLNAKWMPPTSNTQQVEGMDVPSIVLSKDKRVLFKLLSKEEEYDLSLSLASNARAIALLTMGWNQSARELLILVESAITRSLKKRIFSDETYYFALRRELDDLVNAEGNAKLLSLLLIEAKKREVAHSGKPSSALIRHISHLDWPGPLMLAFAKRYSQKSSPTSTLERAFDEYILNKNAPINDWQQPPEKHMHQLNSHYNDYLDARESLVNHNFKLVFYIAKRYAQQPDYLPDLIQEGMCGLIRAAEKFRPATGNRFSTYAHQWIRSKVRTARINIDKVVPVSHDYNNDIRRISQWTERQQATQSPIVLSKLQEELDISKERLESIMRLKQQSLSLDQTPVDNEGLYLHTKIADPSSDFIDKCFNESNERYLSSIIENVLSEREAYIINERFGRLNSDPKTLKQVSEILGLSCERIRQLETGALKKLKRWTDREML